eukprot:snap_masked-scaffold_21-processed-gene-4.37-mRNA-1 protein AED:1.00 eAED:1.00 QI:0/-1/0/0/-1/1/1/0/359
MAYNPYGNKGQPPVVGAQAVPVQAVPVQAVPVGPPPAKMEMTNMNSGDPLAFLLNRPRLLVKQRLEKLEALANLAGFDAVEFANKYDVIDGATGETLLNMAEESNCFIRICCKPNHPLTMRVLDARPGMGGKELMKIDKPFKLGCCSFFDICAQEQSTLLVEGETKLGSSKKVTPCGGFFTPEFDVKNASEEDVYKVKGPCCVVGGLVELCQDQSFELTGSSDEMHKGKIVHLRPGSGMDGLTEIAGDADRLMLELTDTENVDAAALANLLGTVILLDYSFYESGSQFQIDPFTGTCTVNCCNLYCFGCVCPCTWQIGGGGEDDFGDEGGEEAAEEAPEEEAPAEEEPAEEDFGGGDGY